MPPVESDADRAVFLNSDEFAVTATINGADIDGILDDEFTESNGFAGSRPTLLCRTKDIEDNSIEEDQTAVIEGISYTVREIQPDGTGMSLIVLEAP